MASSSSSYDVFLSFRGEDTGKNFTSHLYAGLSQKEVITFREDQELERGKTISQELLKAIKESKISIVIFSRNYASSTWCLDALVEIFECMKYKGQMVMPVFYNVKASEVRKQTGQFRKAFAEHELRFKDSIHKVQRWRAAMTELANLSGWDLQARHESELVEEIVKDVLGKLRKSSLVSSTTNNFVGMSSRLLEMSMFLEMGQLNDVLFIGICGMGGIGKTTIARVVYEELSSQFEGSSFLANVREVQEKHGLVPLQNQLLSEILIDRNITFWNAHSGSDEIRKRLHHKRVLIILDDVNQLDQLKLLAGRHDWFGGGSRIIITTRDEQLLTCHRVDKVYNIKGLSHEESLQLFCLRAFRTDYPTNGYMELSNHFINYCNGLPLALDILGSFLCGKSVNQWKSALDRLKEIPNQEILDKLYISFDGLEEVEKKIFLDIACFFNGEYKDNVIQVLESCSLYPDIGIRVLISKSLITISKERIWMHALLQEMGREIVRRESHEEPGKRSRLWLYKDVSHVLSNDSGTEQVEGIVLNSFEQEDEQLNAKAFMKLKRLRLLKLQNLCLSQGLDHLSNKLRYLEWDGYPFKSLPSTFQPDKLVELHMRCSNMKQLWKGIKPLKMLKVIDLSYSVNLLKTIDLKEAPNLEKLNLEGCIRLYEVHQSIGILKRLVSLNLKDCKSLGSIPDSICDLKSLKFLNFRGCSKLEKLPERLGNMTCSEELNVGGIARRQLPSAKFWDFILPSWFLPRKNPNQNPDSMAMTFPSLLVPQSLRSLDLSYCNLIEGALPNDLSCFSSLETLDLSGNNFFSIPSSIGRLTKLEKFGVANCKKLQSFPNLPSSVLFLGMNGCSALEYLLPRSINKQIKLENLCNVDCKRLQLLPNLSSSVLYLSVDGSTTQETIANPCGAHTSKPSSLTFVNYLKVVEVESENLTTFVKLTSYLHYLLRHSSLGLFSASFLLSMCLAGSEIPGWFNYQSPGSSLEMQLPPYWWTNGWIGFAFCAVFEFHAAALDTCTISCNLQACIAPDDELFLGHSTLRISQNTSTTSDQLWFNSMPNISLSCLDMWEAHNRLKVTFVSDQLRVKHCGCRVTYNRDADELLLCSRPFQNLGLPSNADVDKNKRSCNHDENGNQISKRLRSPVNP